VVAAELSKLANAGVFGGLSGNEREVTIDIHPKHSALPASTHTVFQLVFEIVFVVKK